MSCKLRELETQTGVEFYNHSASGVWVEEIEETTFYGTAKESAISGLIAEMEMLAEEEGLDLDSLADSAAFAFMPPDSERVPMSRDEAEAIARAEIRDFPW